MDKLVIVDSNHQSFFFNGAVVVVVLELIETFETTRYSLQILKVRKNQKQIVNLHAIQKTEQKYFLLLP